MDNSGELQRKLELQKQEFARLAAERERLIREFVDLRIENLGIDDTPANREAIQREAEAELVWRCALNDPRQL